MTVCVALTCLPMCNSPHQQPYWVDTPGDTPCLQPACPGDSASLYVFMACMASCFLQGRKEGPVGLIPTHPQASSPPLQPHYPTFSSPSLPLSPACQIPTAAGRQGSSMQGEASDEYGVVNSGGDDGDSGSEWQ